jgi:hypothetical protein
LSDNIVELNLVTTVDIDPDDVLEGAKGKLTDVFIIGWENDELYLASSTSSVGDLNIVLDIAKQRLLEDYLGE